MMNLISNALKFTPNDGSIKMYVLWHSEDTAKEKLLAKEDYLESPTNNINNDDLTGRVLTREQDVFTSIFDEFSFTEGVDRFNNLNSTKNFHTNILHDKLKQLRFQHPEEFWSVTQMPLINSGRQDIPLNGYLKVQVSDTGVGIPSSKIPKLFNMFEQAHGWKCRQHVWRNRSWSLDLQTNLSQDEWGYHSVQ